MSRENTDLNSMEAMQKGLADFETALEDYLNILNNAGDACRSAMGDGDIAKKYITTLTDGVKKLKTVHTMSNQARIQLEMKIKIAQGILN